MIFQRSDIPLRAGWGRFRCSHCGGRILDAAEANVAIGRGSEVTPLDAATAERIAERHVTAGNVARAQAVRLWAAQRFPAPQPQPAPE
jgi:hypothetical protein